MVKINKRKNGISMLSGFMRDVSTVGGNWGHPAIKTFSSASVGIKSKFFRVREWRDSCTGRAKIYRSF